MPEPIPLGLTLLFAIVLAIVWASFVNKSLGGSVETVFTLRTHFCRFSHRVLSVDRTGADRRDRKYTLYPRRARVRAALRAASERPLRPLVCAARRADAERSVRVRLRATERAWLRNAFLEAALLMLAFQRELSGFGATARWLRLFVFDPLGRHAWHCAGSSQEPHLFWRAKTEAARRAFERPIVIACLVDRAPCLPSLM